MPDCSFILHHAIDFTASTAVTTVSTSESKQSLAWSLKTQEVGHRESQAVVVIGSFPVRNHRLAIAYMNDVKNSLGTAVAFQLFSYLSVVSG